MGGNRVCVEYVYFVESCVLIGIVVFGVLFFYFWLIVLID